MDSQVDVREVLQKGWQCLWLEKFSAAISYFRSAAQKGAHFDGYIGMGRVHLAMKNKQQCLSYIRLCLDVDDTRSEVHSLWGLYELDLMNDVDKATQHFVHGAMLPNATGVAELHYNLGRCWERKGQFSHAANHYRKSHELQPEYQPARDRYYRMIALLN